MFGSLRLMGPATTLWSANAPSLPRSASVILAANTNSFYGPVSPQTGPTNTEALFQREQRFRAFRQAHETEYTDEPFKPVGIC